MTTVVIVAVLFLIMIYISLDVDKKAEEVKDLEKRLINERVTVFKFLDKNSELKHDLEDLEDLERDYLELATKYHFEND